MSAATRARARVGDEEPRWWRGALIALFVLALAWKLVCLVRWIRNPIYPDLSADSAAYWGWAQLIARGALVGHNAFFLGPLYAYLLALFHPLPGAPPTAPLVAQCVLGSATCVLLSLAARAVCSRPHALAVGVLAAGNAMATLLDLSVLSESLLWFLGAVFRARRAAGTGRPRPGTRAAIPRARRDREESPWRFRPRAPRPRARGDGSTPLARRARGARRSHSRARIAPRAGPWVGRPAADGRAPGGTRRAVPGRTRCGRPRRRAR